MGHVKTDHCMVWARAWSPGPQKLAVAGTMRCIRIKVSDNERYPLQLIQ